MNNEILAPLEWSTVKRKVKDLVPYEYNPRRLTDEKKERLRASLEKFNLAEIPAINTDNVIIAGHQRIVVLLEIGRGEEEIDVRIPSRKLTEEEFKQYNITSNVQTGEWDLDILNEIFKDIDLLSLGLNIADIPMPEDNLTKNLIQEEEQEFNPEPPKESISKAGDIYEFVSLQKKLKHRLICGDSTLEETYSLLLGDERLNMNLTDPPYNVNYEGGGTQKLKIKNDNMNNDSFYSFLFEFYSQVFKFSNPGSPIYVFHADTSTEQELKLWIAAFKEKAAHPWYNDRKQQTVLEFNRPTKSEDHPTMKPLDLFTYLMKNSSKQYDLIGDSFSGSGTTLICCEQTWRQARVIELDSCFVDVNVKRYVKYMRDNLLEHEVYKNGQKLSKNELDTYFN